MMKHKRYSRRKAWIRWRDDHFGQEPPHWWPEGETWPPSPPALRRARRHLLPRALLGASLALLFGTLVCSGAIFLVSALLRGLELPTPSTTLGLGLALLVFITVAAMAGRSLRRFFTPLDKLLDASEQVASGDLNVQVPERGTQEVRTLIRSFNDMVCRLREQTEERRDMLADVTHELRTPLTVMQGEIEGMLDGVYPRDEMHLGELLEETRRLSNLIEDLRMMALAERGALSIRKEPTDLQQLLSETLAKYRPRAEAQGVTLTLEMEEDLPLVSVDPLRLRQVLVNLLVNALRYTSTGDMVSVAIRRDHDDATVIQVRDTGSGIQPEHLPHIFDRFYKSSESEGSGLGLAIAKKLVEAHEGKITADSNLGEGTTISINLPY
jgi:two-component system sensor histidine kinase BaeS